MTRAPYALAKSARPFGVGAPELVDTTLGWRFTNPWMKEHGHTDSLGQTAENVAAERRASRGPTRTPSRCTATPRRSRRRTPGASTDELVPVTVKGRKGDTVVDADEGPRRDSSIEALAKLRPAFTKDGSVTAGNSSPLNDGAAAVMVVSDGYAKAHGLTPLAKIRATAVAGVPPRVMGIGPVPGGGEGRSTAPASRWTTSGSSSSTRRSPRSRWAAPASGGWPTTTRG